MVLLTSPITKWSVAEYSYDALGRRVSKTLADRTISYAYDGQKVAEETVSDLSGTVLRTSGFAYGAGGDDDVLAEFRTESGTTVTLHYLKDRLGSTAAVADSSGNVLEEYRYSAFGSPYRKTGDGAWEALGSETETLSGTVRPEPLTDRLYTGREWDSEMGLHYYRARTYSPELGRFLQRDPVWQADQVNPYAYVRNNPLMWTDPTGMWSCPFTEPKKFVKELGAYREELMDKWLKYWEYDIKPVIEASNEEYPFPKHELKEISDTADAVMVTRTVPFAPGNDVDFLKLHTEVVFLKDGKAIWWISNLPWLSWWSYADQETVQQYTEHAILYGNKMSDVKWCIDSMRKFDDDYRRENKLFQRSTFCWWGAIACIAGAVK